jgi:flagellar basal body-associated protein FliL
MDKSKLMMTIIIALLVLLLGTVVGLAIYFMSFGDGIDSRDWHQQQFIRPGDRGPSLMDLEIIPLGDRVSTNLASGVPGRPSDMVTSYIEVGIDSRGDDGEFNTFVTAFNQRISAARSIAIRVLNDLTYDEVRTTEGQAAAAEVIMRRLQEEFDSELVVRVFFSDWQVVRGR